MRAFPSPSVLLRRLNARERRLVLGGALVSATALVLALCVLPLARRWSALEAAYAHRRDRWVRLAALAANSERLRRAAAEQQLAYAGDEARLVAGATPALAASRLQGLLQRYAEESAVQLDRVDVASEPRADTPGLLAIPVQVQGQSDVFGLVDFLYRLQYGELLFATDELTVATGLDASPGRPALTWAIRLHGLYAATERRGGS